MGKREIMGPDGKMDITHRPYTVEERRERRRLRLIEMEKEIYHGDQQRLSDTARDIQVKSLAHQNL